MLLVQPLSAHIVMPIHWHPCHQMSKDMQQMSSPTHALAWLTHCQTCEKMTMLRMTAAPTAPIRLAHRSSDAQAPACLTQTLSNLHHLMLPAPLSQPVLLQVLERPPCRARLWRGLLQTACVRLQPCVRHPFRRGQQLLQDLSEKT